MLVNTSSNPITIIASVLASIGAINWGLIGAFHFNLVTYLFGEMSNLSRIVYILVGVSGLYLLFGLTGILAKPSISDVK